MSVVLPGTSYIFQEDPWRRMGTDKQISQIIVYDEFPGLLENNDLFEDSYRKKSMTIEVEKYGKALVLIFG